MASSPPNSAVSVGGQQATNFRKRLRNKTRSPATVQKSLDFTVPVFQEDIIPLSGNPFFTCVISRSQLSSYRMDPVFSQKYRHPITSRLYCKAVHGYFDSPFVKVIPHHFCELLPRCNVPATLSYGSRRWEVKYCGNDGLKRFTTGWMSFVIDTKLSLGDGCVFELTDKEKLHFRVQILRGHFPVLAAEGGHSDSPIVID